MQNKQDIDKRGEDVLAGLIAAFVDTGKPVGSVTLADDLGGKFSSATIRNTMAELERAGLLSHLHTSGGRYPTDKGMRYYIDKLLKLEPLSPDAVVEIKSKYEGTSYSVSNVLQETSRILSKLSNYAGLVVAPKMGEIVIKHMEFIPLADDRIIGIFVGRDGFVENRIIRCDVEYTYSDLEKVNNYCNRAFYGLSLSDAKNKILDEMESAQKEYDKIINNALILSQKMFFDMEKLQLFVDGGAQLLNVPSLSDAAKASSLLDVLEEKKRLISLLNNTIESERVSVFVGAESGYSAIADCSVVFASYKKDKSFLGTLGVIGPMHMDYSKVIPIVDCTAKLISSFLDGEELYDG